MGKILKNIKIRLVVTLHNILSRSKILRFIAVNLYDTINLCLFGVMRRRHYIKDDKRKVIYMINGKVASSSIEESFISQKMEKEDDIDIEMEKRGLVYYGSPSADTADYYKFSVVRNPFPRLVSCYEYRYHKKKYVNGRCVREYDSYLWGSFKRDKGFREFAHKVCKTPDSRSDQTFISQTYILYKNGRPLVDFIGKIENINEDFAIIREKSKLDEIRHANSTDKHKKNWQDYYDEETAYKVYERYKNDFELLGYNEELEALLSYIRKDMKEK
ncbi:MAG: sulfotransferase family protein [Lachnospiraceae bacterium]|nr:sulfotransferase family protein [Lachnospiraceae bacterium]